MKKLFIVIVLISSIIYAQNIYTTKEITKDNDGYMVENKSNKKINGIVKEYYEDGKLRYEFPYKDGKENGIKKWYYKSGKLESNQYPKLMEIFLDQVERKKVKEIMDEIVVQSRVEFNYDD